MPVCGTLTLLSYTQIPDRDAGKTRDGSGHGLGSAGAGAGSRLSLGTAVVFGMAVNAVLGTLFVPNFWELFENIREKYLSKMFAGSDVVVPPSKDSDNSGADI